MVRPLSLSLVLTAGLGLCACGSVPAVTPSLSYADVGHAPASVAPASGVAMSQVLGSEQTSVGEPGRILKVRQTTGEGFAYTVQRVRDDSVIEVRQADLQPLPAGLMVSIRYGSPVHIMAAPISPDLG